VLCHLAKTRISVNIFFLFLLFFTAHAENFHTQYTDIKIFNCFSEPVWACG